VQPRGMLPVDPLVRLSCGCAISPLCVPVSVFFVLCSCPSYLVDVEMGIA
jgi:hypothetical protein